MQKVTIKKTVRAVRIAILIIGISSGVFVSFNPAYGGSLQDGIVYAWQVRGFGGLPDFAGNPALVIALIVRAILTFGTVLAFGGVVVGGIMYIMSLGDEQKVRNAKMIILYALIGLFILLLSVIIINAAMNIFA